MAESKLIRTLYDASPAFVQDVMTSLYGYRKNAFRYKHPKSKFWEDVYRDQLAWTERQLRDYQWKECKKTLQHAYESVPFYRDRFRELGLTPDDINGVDDLRKLPYTTKDDLRQHGRQIISEAFDATEITAHPTSGSTGQPLYLYSAREAIVRNHAVRWSQCRPGLQRGMPSANFTGLEIVKPGQSRPPFWRTNHASRQRLYSVFHMSDQTLPHYVEDLNRFRPDWLYGYPSAIFTLAEFMERTDRRLEKQIKAVVTSSEECLDQYRDVVERVFNTTLWDEYGQAELGGLAFQCECGRLHENISYSFIEFLPTGEQEDGLQVSELICTSTINPAWPLIRYRVGDTALIDPTATCPAGKPGRIIQKMHGRTSQFLETRDGRRISNISVMAKKCRHLKSCQAIQEKPGEMILRIVRDSQFVDADAQHALAEFRKKLGDEDKMAIRIEYADQPLLTKSGKFLMIVSKVRVI